MFVRIYIFSMKLLKKYNNHFASRRLKSFLFRNGIKLIDLKTYRKIIKNFAEVTENLVLKFKI